MPSGTGSPLPSSSRPRMRIARGSSSETRDEPMRSRSRPMARYGPAVWDGVRPGVSLIVRLLERRGLPATDDDVEPEAECPLRLGEVEVEPADQALAALLVGNRVEDRVEREQRVA